MCPQKSVPLSVKLTSKGQFFFGSSVIIFCVTCHMSHITLLTPPQFTETKNKQTNILKKIQKSSKP